MLAIIAAELPDVAATAENAVATVVAVERTAKTKPARAQTRSKTRLSKKQAPPKKRHIKSEARDKPRVKLIGRKELLERVPISYPVCWRLMNEGKFPRSRQIGGKSFWIEREIDEYLDNLPLVKLKSDAE
jgi:predicted DNA-binding transcriptional regulator AlpA